MATADEEVLYSFKMDTTEAVRAIEEAKTKLAELKAEEKSLREETDENEKSSDAYIRKLADLTIQQEKQKIVIKGNTDALKAHSKEITSELGSLNQLSAQLRAAELEFRKMSKAEREGAEGQELQKKILGLRTDLKTVEASTGDFRRNVGNYLNSIKSAFADAGGAAGKMATGVSGVTMKVKALIAVPLIALLNGIIFVVQKVIGALKSSEGSFNKVRVAMSGLQGVGDLVTRMLQGLGKGIAWVAEKLGSLLSKLNVVDEAAKKRKEITEQQIALEKRRREVTVENADLELEASQLLNQIEQKNIYSSKERLELVDRANEKILKIAKNNEELAKRNYEVIKATNALTDSSTEDLQAEADAYAAMKAAEKEYFDRSKELATKKIELQNEILANNAKEVKQLVESSAEVEVILGKLPALGEGIGTALTDMAHEGMQGYVDEIKAGLDQSKAYWENELEVTEEIAQEEIDIQYSKAAAIGSIFGNLSALTAQFGEKNAKLAKASKVLAVAQVAIEGGIAIAKATKSGADLGIPGIIATVATAVTNLALALAQINSAKFSTGGYVKGPGTSTSDSIPAMLSNGESVINARSTKMFAPILSAINQAGGGVAFGNEVNGYAFARGGYIGNSTIQSGRNTLYLQDIADSIQNSQVVLDLQELTDKQKRVIIKEMM